MKRQHAIKQASPDTFGWTTGISRAIFDAGKEWSTTDGLTWLHLFKTVTAALLALGIAMLLELQQPRTAMTTVFVLMQPFSGMVLAKSFYRIVGTFIGMLAALLLGALFAQQPELYMLGITAWMGACVAAAVRYRHFRWYGFVLAGYTAALIGIPTVMEPNGLFLAALTRAAEVAIGIVCSAAVSALIVPRRSSLALQNALQSRHLNFSAFAVKVLDGAVERGASERYFADLVDEVVGFEATRAFAAFEDPGMRSRSQVLARLNHEFMDVCARLHALHQLRKRLRGNAQVQVEQATAPYFRELSQMLGAHSERRFDSSDAARVAIRLKTFQSTLPARMRATRRPLESGDPQCLPDFDTAGELLYRFVVEFIRCRHLRVAGDQSQSGARAPSCALREPHQCLRGRVHVRAHGGCRRDGECVLDSDELAGRRHGRDRRGAHLRADVVGAESRQARVADVRRRGVRNNGRLSGHVLSVSRHRRLCAAHSSGKPSMAGYR